jgi:hypothetical protein
MASLSGLSRGAGFDRSCASILIRSAFSPGQPVNGHRRAKGTMTRDCSATVKVSTSGHIVAAPKRELSLACAVHALAQSSDSLRIREKSHPARYARPSHAFWHSGCHAHSEGTTVMRWRARNWFMTVAITTTLVGSAARMFSELPKHHFSTTVTISSEPDAPAMRNQKVTSNPRVQNSDGRVSGMKKPVEDARPGACAPAQQTGPHGAWPARAEPAVTFCPL